MIAGYIPSPRDETLGPFEYYYKQETASGPRIIKVEARRVFPGMGIDGPIEYDIYQGYKRIDAGYGDPWRGVRKGQLYDNKEDCSADTHYFYDDWETLRRMESGDDDAE